MNGSVDGTNSAARFSLPYGIAVDSGGNIYVSDDASTVRRGVPLPPVFQTVAKTGGTLTFTWTAAAGQAFQVQYKTNLVQTNWGNLGSAITATNSVATASDVIASNRQRFYRVKVVP